MASDEIRKRVHMVYDVVVAFKKIKGPMVDGTSICGRLDSTWIYDSKEEMVVSKGCAFYIMEKIERREVVEVQTPMYYSY